MIRKVGLYFLLMPLISYVISVVAFVCGGHISPAVLLCGSALALIILYGGRSWKKSLIPAVFVLALQLVTILIAANIYDPSYDGQVYHAATIKYLAQGWNPFYKFILPPCELPPMIDPDISIWISHYAKGMEVIEATVVSTTGNLEAGKALNFWFYISLLCVTWVFFGEIDRLRKPGKRVLMTLLACANPVVLSQIFTYYIDYACYTVITIGVMLYYLYLKRKKGLYLFALVLLCFFTPAVKFNTAFWFVLYLLAGAGFIYWLTRKIDYKAIAWCAVIFVAGFAGGGFNPYITNIIEKNNMLYPLAGEGKIDIITDLTPEFIRYENRWVQVNSSLVSNPNSFTESGIANPLAVSKSGVFEAGSCETRTGGFGIFFFEASILLLIIFFTLFRRKNWFAVALILLLLYGSLFILPGGFWARYVPFYYLSVCVMTAYILYYSTAVWRKVGAYIGGFLLLINGGITISMATYLAVNQTLKTECLLAKLRLPHEEPVYLNTISFTLLDKVEQESPETIVNRLDPFDGSFLELTVGIDSEISGFPELTSSESRPWLLQKIGYNPSLVRK